MFVFTFDFFLERLSAYLCIRPAARKLGCVVVARTQPSEDCMIVARIKRLSTPVALAISTIDSWIAAVSSSVLRATSQVSQDCSMICWLAANLESVSLNFPG